jgi:hypothetical protein
LLFGSAPGLSSSFIRNSNSGGGRDLIPPPLSFNCPNSAFGIVAFPTALKECGVDLNRGSVQSCGKLIVMWVFVNKIPVNAADLNQGH